jgi:hypothetical protein
LDRYAWRANIYLRDVPAAIRIALPLLMLRHGRERTAAEYERMLGVRGLRLALVVPTRPPAGVSVIEVAPAAPRERGDSGD